MRFPSPLFSVTRMPQRGRLDMAVKAMLMGPYRKGFDIKVRSGERSFDLRRDVDWEWLGQQRGKIDINFRIDPTQQPIEMSTINILLRQVLRKRKRWHMLQTTRQSCKYLRPQEGTLDWLAVLGATNFNLLLRYRVEADGRLEAEKKRLDQTNQTTDFRMRTIPEAALADSVMQVPVNTEATLSKGLRSLHCSTPPPLEPLPDLLSPIKTPPDLKQHYDNHAEASCQNTPPRLEVWRKILSTPQREIPVSFAHPHSNIFTEKIYSPVFYANQPPTPGKNLENRIPFSQLQPTACPYTLQPTASTFACHSKNTESLPAQPPTPGKFLEVKRKKKEKTPQLRKKLRDLFGNSDSEEEPFKF